MKRILMVLGVALIACALAWSLVYHFRMQLPADEWVGTRLGLSGAALERFTEAHNRYNARCAEMCIRIRESDSKLAELVLGNDEFTPEIAEAMARSDALRHECRQNMLKHFYGITKLLDATQRDSYLDLVMPLIVQPELMSSEHWHHE